MSMRAATKVAVDIAGHVLQACRSKLLYRNPLALTAGCLESGRRKTCTKLGIRIANSMVSADSRQYCRGGSREKEQIMLNWALTFLIIALIAAVFGFGGIAGTAAWIAQV